MLNEVLQNPTQSRLQSHGWTEPIECLTVAQAATMAAHVQTLDLKPDAAWSKDLATRDRWIWDLASSDLILQHIQPLLGENIVLWGSSVVTRKPGQAHPWHSDIEVWNANETDAISVWIGLKATSQASSLSFINGSHRSGVSVQEAASGLPRDSRTDDAILQLARSRCGGEAALSTPNAWDGAMLMFAGGTWHGSLNTRSEGTRVALLLQFARAGFRIRQPDWSQLDWPFDFDDNVSPPLLCVSGDSEIALDAGNRVVSPPPASPPSMWDPSISLSHLPPHVHSWDPPLAVAPGGGWQPTLNFEGHSQILRKISAHASTLTPGEELLLMLAGEAELHYATDPNDPSPQAIRVAAGDFAYYPSCTCHTISCPAEATEPAQYIMFRWNARPAWGPRTPTSLTRQQPWSLRDLFPTTGRGFASQLVAEGPTTCLPHLHLHASTVECGSGYPAHEDEYDVGIVLLEGTIETLGKQIHAPAILFHPAGTAHGLKAVSESPARYLVVEFHHPPDPDLPPPHDSHPCFRLPRHSIWKRTRPSRDRLIASLRSWRQQLWPKP